MHFQDDLNLLMGFAENRKKIDIARRMEPFTDDSRVMDVLCTTAIYTDHHALREVLLDVLKTNPAGAFVRFSDYALWSKDPVARKHALINLSLMGCRKAQDAVISGLYDPDASVRQAAAMSAGLYDDIGVRAALERYFENHWFELTLSFIADGVDAIRKRTRRSDAAERMSMALKPR